MNENSTVLRVAYNHGRNISPVGFVFACPGRRELLAQKVVAGSTGNNLNRLLASLFRSSDPHVASLFPSSNRYDYLITNTSDIVHYPALDGQSLPSKKEYMSPQNIERLCAELADLKIIIAFGAQAKDVLSEVQRRHENEQTFITSLPHLSFLSLNQISHDVNESKILPGAKDGTDRRIEVVKAMLEKQIQDILR